MRNSDTSSSVHQNSVNGEVGQGRSQQGAGQKSTIDDLPFYSLFSDAAQVHMDWKHIHKLVTRGRLFFHVQL